MTTSTWDNKEIGPFWMGDLWDNKLAKDVINEIESNTSYGQQIKLLTTLEVIKEESSLPPLYFDIHKICKKLKIEVPKFSWIQQKLTEKEIKNSRTHFSPTGLRLAGSELDLVNILKYDIK